MQKKRLGNTASEQKKIIQKDPLSQRYDQIRDQKHVRLRMVVLEAMWNLIRNYEINTHMEVNHTMRRLRLNMYRAEDAMYLLRKRQWDMEDAEFARSKEGEGK
jgi:hypothetical protein